MATKTLRADIVYELCVVCTYAHIEGGPIFEGTRGHASALVKLAKLGGIVAVSTLRQLDVDRLQAISYGARKGSRPLVAFKNGNVEITAEGWMRYREAENRLALTAERLTRKD